MKFDNYIEVLIYQHDCVVIPGFGGFIANLVSAHIHPVLHTFVPPSRKIMFNASLLHNDGLLANHIARKEGINYVNALNIIAEEVVELLKALKSGKTITWNGLGTMRSNRENSFVFTPDTQHNYLEDAYGLPTFVSPYIRAGESRPLLPLAVRRIAAIAIPLLAIGMWSLFNKDRINNFTSNYTSIFPTSEILSQFSVSTVNKSAPVYVSPGLKSFVSNTQLTSFDTQEATLNVTAAVEKTSPGTTEHVTTEPVTTELKNSANVVETNTGEKGHYLIIGGAFKEKKNAEKLLAQLKSQDFDATIAGQNKGGLYLVSAASCDDSDMATLKLKEVLDKGIEAAWILKN